MRTRAFYNYAIVGFEANKNNEEVIDIHYGNAKMPLHIFKKDAYKFIAAIIPLPERKKRCIVINTGDEVMALNFFLKGRAMILCTDFKNYFEYANKGQNDIKEIAGLSIDGNINLAEAFDYTNLEPDIELLYDSE